MDSSRAAAYDFTINGVSTNIAYAYEGQQIVFALEDKYGMAGDIEWTWRTDKSSGSDKYKNHSGQRLQDSFQGGKEVKSKENLLRQNPRLSEHKSGKEDRETLQ